MAGYKATPLLEIHRSLGAKLIDFAGWDMPLQYSGVIAEHNAVRSSCGLFDVTHLGKLSVSGPTAGEALQVALTADVEGLAPGRATYSLVLTEDGGCIDDVFVYRIARDEWLVVPNAANVEPVAAAIADAGGEVVDAWDRYAILALQGPDSFAVFDRVFPGTDAAAMKLYSFGTIELAGSRALVARTGYTGERGFEIYVAFDAAEKVFTALLDGGAAPVGLGARDTLRLEMGYALYGHEISLDINPLEAGLGWALSWETPFRGRDALAAIKAARPRRKLFGVRCRDRGVPRQGYHVSHDGIPVGDVTSGNHSPTLGTGIALVLGPRDTVPDPGAIVAIEARGRAIAGDIVKPPFVGKGRG
ncbi:MAG TPA: glycine cleavage system aminomethyltransferase GcvT [Actinomycetota bacterium]|nr:glycine cleavage system aminomethyltransferase GcvT [Actinomycetota bacterium]